MSYAHKNEFERIKNEYDEVKRLLSWLSKQRQPSKVSGRGRFSGLPAFDSDIVETALATIDDAYALLLMAKAEGFMRTYLNSLGIQLGPEPKLNTLIDKCRKEFNNTNPRIPMRANIAQEVHDLRAQRNAYAHGQGSNVFPSIARMVIILGRFFDQLS